MIILSKTKKWLKSQIVKSGVLRHCSKILPSGAVILRYHSVQQDPQVVSDSIGIGITHSAAIFKKQMEHISKYYNPVSMDDIRKALEKGESLSNGSVAVSFDDGFRDNVEVAAPILDRFGVPAVFYITTGAVESPLAPWYIRLRKAFYNTQVHQWVEPDSDEKYILDSEENREAALVAACKSCAVLAGEKQNALVDAIKNSLRMENRDISPSIMMSWSQIRELEKNGHNIGSHTITHPNMAYVNQEDLKIELEASRKLLEEKIQSKVIHFSYPSPMLEPHWTEQTVFATQKAGYKTATTCTSGNVTARDNALCLKRMWVPFEMNEFVWYLDNHLIGRNL